MHKVGSSFLQDSCYTCLVLLPKLPKSSFLTPAVRDYVAENSTAPDIIQQQLIAETKELGDIAIMQIPPEQGTLLTILTQAMSTQQAIEIGTFTGYSALCIARGLPASGKLITLDTNEEWAAIARKYWQKAEVDKKIELVIGPAIETLRALPSESLYDLAFLDADKVSYVDYYEEILPRMRPGGIILVDNVLWFGLAADPLTQDKTAQVARAFNSYVMRDSRVDKVMLPIADGLSVLRKIS